MTLVVVVAACGPRAVLAPPPVDRIAIVVSERGPSGARLVAVDEHGDRQFVVVAPAATHARDSHPVISPDRQWLVFASSRGRTLDQTSLWIARLGVDAVATRLTDTNAIDSHPTWTPDGRAIVFASTRDGGDFDLWRLPITRGRAGAAPTQLTHGAGHEVTPTVAADGTVIYAAVAQVSATEVSSHLEERAPDGSVKALTAGPADTAPALSPDGTWLAFARPQIRGGVASSELWRVPRGGDAAVGAPAAELLLALPLTEESGPVWSLDGRFVFATSVLRGEAGVVFSAVVHVDLREPRRVARMLRDHAGAIVRLTPAIATPALDVAALHADPEYLPELARIMREAIEEHSTQ